MMGVHGACEEVALGVYAGAAGAGGDEGGEGGCAGCGGVGGVVVVVVGGGGADGDVDVGVAWSASVFERSRMIKLALDFYIGTGTIAVFTPAFEVTSFVQKTQRQVKLKETLKQSW
jgi:hypothetical protein